jgi:hypothetical protein
MGKEANNLALTISMPSFSMISAEVEDWAGVCTIEGASNLHGDLPLYIPGFGVGVIASAHGCKYYNTFQ